jgi:hypothetical protein
MSRRLFCSLLIVVVMFAGIVPAGAEVSSGGSGHACCGTVDKTESHHSCPQPAPAKMSCCAPAPDRSSETKAPPADTTRSLHPAFTLLTGHAAYVPGLPGLACESIAEAFESACLKLPRDPLYLRHLVLLV